MPTRPLTPDEYQAREKVYDEMAELVKATPAPTVVLVLAPEEAHVHIHVPGTEKLEDVQLAGQKGLYALSLYLEELARLIASATKADAQS